jgi:hypothetical protein
MAFSNTYDVTNPGSAVSNREDLTDVLTILAPEETPVLSSAQKQRAVATNTPHRPVRWTRSYGQLHTEVPPRLQGL